MEKEDAVSPAMQNKVPYENHPSMNMSAKVKYEYEDMVKYEYENMVKNFLELKVTEKVDNCSGKVVGDI